MVPKAKKNPQRIRFCSDNGRGFVDGCDVELIDDDKEDVLKENLTANSKSIFFV